MALVQIEAAEDVLRAAAQLPGLNVVRSSFDALGEGRWKAAAYASDEAVEAARALGADVRIMVPTDVETEQRQQLAARIAQERTRGGEA